MGSESEGHDINVPNFELVYRTPNKENVHLGDRVVVISGTDSIPRLYPIKQIGAEGILGQHKEGYGAFVFYNDAVIVTQDGRVLAGRNVQEKSGLEQASENPIIPGLLSGSEIEALVPHLIGEITGEGRD